MKTTVELPDQLLRQAKILAVQQGRSLKDLITEALHAHIATGPPAPPIPRSGTGGLGDDDPFFAALEQVRSWGNSQMPGNR